MAGELVVEGADEVVVGKAGTGKTYALDAARRAWRQAGTPVTGVALAARAALELQDTAGIPVPKDYREVARELVDNQGWRYDRNPKGKHPKLCPPDSTTRPIPVPTTPSTSPRALKNFVAQIRRAGGIWPTPRDM